MAAAAHQQMLPNQHLSGNAAVLVQTPVSASRSLEDALEARRPD